jgi:hypothetical protein
MQPYERRRAGDIVGTSGSRPPSFPVQKDAEAMLGQLDEYEHSGGIITFTPSRTIHEPDAAVPAPLPEAGQLRIAREPRATDGVWVLFRNVRWFSAGKAVVFDPTAFERIGQYEGFPVFRATVGRGDVIYIPSRDGLVTPYARR